VRYFVSMAFKETGKIEEAFALWKELVRSPLTIQLRSSLYVYMGDYYYTYKKDLAQAVFYYTKLLNEYPYTTFKSQAQLRVGQCLVQEGKAPDAVYYLNAVAQDGSARKEKKEALLLLAGIYEAQREYAQADAVYNRYGLLFPDETRFIAYKKGVLSFLQDDYRGAIEYLQQAVQQGYVSLEVQFYLAAAKEKIGQTEEAIALYQQVVSSSQTGEFAIQSYIHLARLYEKKGNQPAAIEAYRILSESNSEEAAFAREKLAQLTQIRQ
jgi:tetratricopeptide (TPR) repeat protein